MKLTPWLHASLLTLACADAGEGQAASRIPDPVESAAHGLVAAYPPVAGRPSVIFVHGVDPDITQFKNAVATAEKHGYNFYYFIYRPQLGFLGRGAANPVLNDFIGSLDSLSEASSALADAAKWLIAQTGEKAVNLGCFSLGGVVGIGSVSIYTDHPELHTLAGNDPNAPPVNIVTFNSPLGGMSGMRDVGPRIGAVASGIFTNFYSEFRNPLMWYLRGDLGPNVHHELGASPSDDVVTREGMERPTTNQPQSRIDLLGTHVDGIQLQINVDRMFDSLDELNGRQRVSMAVPSGPYFGTGTELVAFGGVNQAGFGNAVDSACTVIGGRFAAANYDSSSCTGAASAGGFEIGGGISVPVGSRAGVDVLASVRRFGDLSLTTTGARASGNLRFDETSAASFRVFTVMGGPSFVVTTRVQATPLVGFMSWHATETLVDSLLAGSPQTKVQGGSTTTATSGTAVIVGARARLALHPRVRSYVEYVSSPSLPVFAPNGKAGWPADLRINRVAVGLEYGVDVPR